MTFDLVSPPLYDHVRMINGDMSQMWFSGTRVIICVSPEFCKGEEPLGPVVS